MVLSISIIIGVQRNPCCEATPLASEYVTFKRGLHPTGDKNQYFHVLIYIAFLY